MSRTLKTEIPGTDWRVSLETLRETGVEGLFAGRGVRALPLVVEVGFGRGEFLLELARAAPGQAFVGVEYSYKRTLKMARRLARSELTNVTLVEARAEDVLRDALPDASVSSLWLNFPDPWPKKRHARRRFVQHATLARIATRLVPGGLLHVATDHAEYAEWIDEHLAAQPDLLNRHAPERWRSEVSGRTPTAYELEWRAQGRSFFFFEYARREPGERDGTG